MPTSQFNQLNKIVNLILTVDPASVLDIGVGFGKFGLLTREYLEFWYKDKDYNNWTKEIDGIEVFEKYINPVHRYIYNNIYIGNAIDVLPTLNKKYDLILLIDVLEHFDYHTGLKLLEMCRMSAHNILISFPKDIGDQGDSFGNPNEKHEFQWKKSLLKNSNTFFVGDSESVIVLISDDINIVKKNWNTRKTNTFISNMKTNIKYYFTPLYKLYKKVKHKTA